MFLTYFVLTSKLYFHSGRKNKIVFFLTQAQMFAATAFIEVKVILNIIVIKHKTNTHLNDSNGIKIRFSLG